ncbi:MAG: hypothetical protein K9W44_03905 [Candidatus Lokiarchaeota archaeon]|nr:hypothetical protein [Candidatus Harpocratesius repetitus]
MLFFQWEHIDWIKWMPVEVGVLFILIIFIRLLRRYRRWNKVILSHVVQKEWKMENYSGNLYQYGLNDEFLGLEIERNSLSQLQNKLVDSQQYHFFMIAPLQGGKKVESLIGSTLALLNAKVWTMSPSNFYKLLERNSSPIEFLQKFLIDNEIDTIILFDHSIFPYFSTILNYPEHYSFPKLKYIFIRPTWIWSDIKSFFSLIWTPLQAIYYLYLIPFRKIYKKYTSSKIETTSLKSLIKDLLCIFPAKNWVNSKENDIFSELVSSISERNEIRENISINEFRFTKGDWWFFRNETVIIGLIARFLKIDCN